MCFSAEASFAASGVLAASSVAIARVPKERSSVPLSLFPAVFATHQFVEGILWLEHDGVLPDSYKTAAVYLYVLIAYVLWPVFVPFAAYLTEAGRRRRIVILLCQAIGLGVGLMLLVANVGAPIDVSADCCSLSYSVNAPPWLIAPYLIAVSIPFLISSQRTLVVLVWCSLLLAPLQPSWPPPRLFLRCGAFSPRYSVPVSTCTSGLPPVAPHSGRTGAPVRGPSRRRGGAMLALVIASPPCLCSSLPHRSRCRRWPDITVPGPGRSSYSATFWRVLR
jgi:hypothetical protein